jgi:phospholipase/lecithinase/hemolysin
MYVATKPFTHDTKLILFGLIQTGSNGTVSADFWESEMKSYFGAVERVHAATHGNAAHLFLSVPPEERSPATINNPAKAALQAGRIADYNAALASHVAAFAGKYPDSKVMLFDSHAFFGYVLDNYASFGFKNITSYCTCDDNTYFWYSKHTFSFCG